MHACKHACMYAWFLSELQQRAKDFFFSQVLEERPSHPVLPLDLSPNFLASGDGDSWITVWRLNDAQKTTNRWVKTDPTLIMRKKHKEHKAIVAVLIVEGTLFCANESGDLFQCNFLGEKKQCEKILTLDSQVKSFALGR